MHERATGTVAEHHDSHLVLEKGAGWVLPPEPRLAPRAVHEQPGLQLRMEVGGP